MKKITILLSITCSILFCTKINAQCPDGLSSSSSSVYNNFGPLQGPAFPPTGGATANSASNLGQVAARGVGASSGMTEYYTNFNDAPDAGLWWTYTTIINPYLSSFGATGNMVFSNYNASTGIATWVSTSNFNWYNQFGSFQSYPTQMQVQFQPYTGTHIGQMGSGWLTPTTAGNIGLSGFSSNWPVLDVKALTGTTDNFQVWFRFITNTGTGILDIYDNNNSGPGVVNSSATGNCYWSIAQSNCSASTVTVAASGGFAPYTGTGNYLVGAGTNTYTVTDAHGCTSSTTITTTNPPAVTPTITGGSSFCSGGTLTLNAGAGYSAYLWDNGSTGQTRVVNAAGTYSVTVTNSSGCTGSASQVVSVLPNYNIISSAGANGSISPNGTTPVCSGTNQTYTITPTGGFHILDVLVDGVSNAGAIGSGTYTFTSVGTTHTISATFAPNCTAPLFTTCPGTTTANTATGICSNTVTYTTATSGTTPTITYSFSGATTGTGSGDGSGSSFNMGTTAVTVTATNGCGAANCNFNVVVSDNIIPTITAPATVNATTNTGCTATGVVLGTPTTGDNCTVASTTNDAPTAFPLGNTIVTWTVTDGSGNTATATQTVTVTDNINPTITAPATVNATTNTGCTATVVSLGTPTTGDNCTVASTTNDAPTAFPLGNTIVTWTVTDGSGNTATATQTVTVTDNINPTITAPATVNATTNTGFTATGVSLGTPTTGDNCTVASTTNDAPTAFPLGNTIVTWTVTDGAGNTATATQIVTVTDNINPTITAPVDVNTTTNTGCTATGVVLGTPTTADNCTVASTTNNAPTAFPLGSTTVIWTVTDGSGNTATATQIVTVTDNINPTITAPANVSATTNSGCTATGVVLGTPTTADNCTVASTTNNAPTAFPLGNTTVIWTVTDGAGNTATATQIVTVTDNINPTITAPSDVTVCNGVGISLGTPITADNCTVASISNNAPGSYPVGTTVVTWTVTDGSGNIATATQNVVVNPLPVGSASNIVICNGDPSNVPLSSTITGSTYTWTAVVTIGSVIGGNDCSSNCGNTIADILTNLGFVHGVVEYTVTPTSPSGCSGSPFVVDVTVGAAPATPVISGPIALCGLTSTIYTVAAIPEATTYTWTVPTNGATGMTIVSGQGTTALHVSISAGTVQGNVTCVASNNCGSSGTATLAVQKKPFAPGVITGPTSTCGQGTATYSIASVFGATSYSWHIPAGFTVTAGTGTTQITVSISSAFINGNVSVDAVNACGFVPTTSTNILNVTGNVPIAPVTISGPTNVCGITSATYSVAGVAGATGYQWAVTGTGMSISGSATGLSVTVLFNGVNGGTISCLATNVCGNGPARTQALSVAAIQPGGITGPANVCGMLTATYSVASVGTGYTYNWTAPAGITITGGNGTTQITVSIPASTTSNTQTNTLKVTSTNTCGSTSAIRSMNITRCLGPVAMNGNKYNFTSIYPNPASTVFTVALTSAINDEVTVEMYDILGNLLIQQKHQIVEGENNVLTDIEQLKSGMYFVRIVDSGSNAIYTQRVVKQ